MRRRKMIHFQIKRQISVLMAVLCAATILATPVSAEELTEGEQTVAAEEMPDPEEVSLGLEPGLSMEVSAEAAEKIPVDKEHFPDVNFRKYLKNRYGADINPAEVEYLLLWRMEISDLSGIEYFPNLMELNCSENHLTTIDVTSNRYLEIFSCDKNELTSLDLSGNPFLLELQCSDNALTSLDLSANPYLEDLCCVNNQLTELDLTELPNLTYLECDRNPIQELDVSHNPLIESLGCRKCGLTELDLSDNPMLDYLDCSYNQLVALDLTSNKRLSDLECVKNQLISLDVTCCPMLRDLDCRYNQLANLVLTENPQLDILECSNNVLTGLDLSENLLLRHLACQNNKIRRLDVSMLTSIYEFACDDDVTVKKAAQPILLRLKDTKISVGTETRFYSAWGESRPGKKTYTVGNPNVAKVSDKGVITALKVGTTTIKVRAEATRSYKAAVKTYTLKVVPGEVERFAAKNLAAGIKLAWTKVPGAKGYLLYRKTGSGSYSLIKKITDPNRLSYVDKSGLKNGKKYTYKILPYADTGAGRLPKTKTITRQG